MKQRGDPLGELLERITSSSHIFKDREVLRADYIPGNLPHRWEHIKRLGEIVSTGLRMHRPSNVFIYGKTGTGKTAVVKHVFKRFSSEAERLGIPLRFVYVNCRIAGTEYRVLAELCESLNVQVPFTGLSKGEVFNRFRRALSSSQNLLIVCLDEVDVLVKSAGDALLYELTRINESLEYSRLSLIGVSNDLTFKEMLDPRVLSSLSEEEIVFHPYTAVELVDILSERARLAFREGVMPQSTINLCAALAAAEHGDARRALDLLRVAAEIAERNLAERVEEQHVRTALGVIEQGRLRGPYDASATWAYCPARGLSGHAELLRKNNIWPRLPILPHTLRPARTRASHGQEGKHLNLGARHAGSPLKQRCKLWEVWEDEENRAEDSCG